MYARVLFNVYLWYKSKAVGPLFAGVKEKLGKEGKKGPLVSMTESVGVTLLAHIHLVLLKVKPPIEIKFDITCAHRPCIA